MLKFIIRLDDACEDMCEEKWSKVEHLLDKYKIKPIVGIIPENKDKSFNYKKIDDFWNKYALKWQKKGWIIAQHGLNHKYHYYISGKKKIRTEFFGLDYDTQYNMLAKGYKILKENNITPTCFFAPNHTFDKNTIKACKTLNCFKFISDGIAQYPFKYNEMLHFPNIFDTPHKILNNGIYTFVFHPNNITDENLINLEKFIIKYNNCFDINLDEIIKKYQKRKRNIIDYSLSIMIKIYRKLKGNDLNE